MELTEEPRVWRERGPPPSGMWTTRGTAAAIFNTISWEVKEESTITACSVAPLQLKPFNWNRNDPPMVPAPRLQP